MNNRIKLLGAMLGFCVTVGLTSKEGYASMRGVTGPSCDTGAVSLTECGTQWEECPGNGTREDRCNTMLLAAGGDCSGATLNAQCPVHTCYEGFDSLNVHPRLDCSWSKTDW
jgi:hypothetical protein